MIDKSRRAALRGMIGAGVGVAALAAGAQQAAAQEKMDQKSVQYQEQPKDGHQCSGCSQFVAPNACKLVAGNIHPNGWCLLWNPKEG